MADGSFCLYVEVARISGYFILFKIGRYGTSSTRDFEEVVMFCQRCSLLTEGKNPKLGVCFGRFIRPNVVLDASGDKITTTLKSHPN